MDNQSWSRLSEFAKQRRRFDPSNSEDLKEFSYFKKTGKWKDTCPFFIEWPYQDVSTMCNAMYADYMLDTIVQTRTKSKK